MHPVVSVIVPCYNSEKTISQTLDSLREQTLRDFEVIVVNDGANDNSTEIIRQYQAKDPRVKRIEQKNQSLLGARNAGLSIARSELKN